MATVQGSSGGTLLGELVRAGETQEAPEPINDFIWMSKDVSNSYLVTGDGADVVINAGMPKAGARHRALYAKVSSNPIAYVVLTQAHFDHFGGLNAFDDEGTIVIAHRNFPFVRDYWTRLGPFYTRRSNQLWGGVLAMGERPLDFHDHMHPEQSIDVFADDGYTFSTGGRRFELLHVPGGETLDSLLVWMPDEKVVFTGNVFGPLYLNQPNLNTLRGDLPRDALRFADAVRKVQALGAELLITGHGDPIRGAERIRADLQRLLDSVMYVHDQTVAGMNAGKDVHTLMREIAPPGDLRIGEGHGMVPINVRSIWEQYAGFFHYRSTTELFEVPQSSIAGDLVELAGIGPLTERARAHAGAGHPLEALHLVDIVREAAPEDKAIREVEANALEQLLRRGKEENFSVTMWLKGRIAMAKKEIEA